MVQTFANAVILGSSLILSPGSEFYVQISGGELWLSQPDVVEVQSQTSTSARLTTTKKTGEVFIYGIKNQPFTKISLTTENNHKALKKCREVHSSLFVDEQGNLQVQNLTEDLAHKLYDCGFDKLSAESDPLSKLAIQKSETLQNIGLSLSEASESLGRIIWNTTSKNHRKIKKQLGELSPFVELLTSETKSQNTIVLKIDLFEFSKSSQSGLSLTGTPKSSNGLNLAKISTPSDVAIAYGNAQKNGKLIASPQLRTIPGKTAEFNSGGEIPVQDAQVLGAKTTWKAYGLKIQITPSPDSSPLNPEIATAIQIEYSQPDFGTSVQGVPSMITRNLKNEFYLKMNQTTLLTSMVQIRKGNSKESVFGLSWIPFVGSLLFSNQNHQDQTELWFLISPQWASKISTKEISKKWLQN